MGRANILICPSCDYKRHLTEAESLISHALVVACLKCGGVMQCNPKKKEGVITGQQPALQSRSPEALEEWVVP